MDTPENLVVDLNALTINDLIEFEGLAGVTFDEFTQELGGQNKKFTTTQMMMVYRALVYIIGRRDNPALTLEAAGETTIGAIAKIELKGGGKPNPTNGGESKGGG